LSPGAWNRGTEQINIYWHFLYSEAVGLCPLPLNPMSQWTQATVQSCSISVAWREQSKNRVYLLMGIQLKNGNGLGTETAFLASYCSVPHRQIEQSSLFFLPPFPSFPTSLPYLSGFDHPTPQCKANNARFCSACRQQSCGLAGRLETSLTLVHRFPWDSNHQSPGRNSPWLESYKLESLGSDSTPLSQAWSKALIGTGLGSEALREFSAAVMKPWKVIQPGSTSAGGPHHRLCLPEHVPFSVMKGRGT
jgi:hypothetical protein